MNKPLTLLVLLCCISCFGQECVYKDLSKTLYFSVDVTRHDNGWLDSCSVKIDIFRKEGNLKAQEIRFESNNLFPKSFIDKTTSRSYTTGYNENIKDNENDWGDLILADFNFDGEEDFAIKGEEGGNGGPLYLFYIQDKSGAFAIDQFLTEEMIFFPKKIDPAKKQLTTLVRANTYEDCERVYQLTGKWEEISKRYMP